MLETDLDLILSLTRSVTFVKLLNLDKSVFLLAK